MKHYKLLKDLPMFKAGDRFHTSSKGNLVHTDSGVVAYMSCTLKKFPNILADWFEEFLEGPRAVWDLKDGDECWMLDMDLKPLKIEWRGTPYDIRLRELGLVYLTKEELLAKQARNEAEQILLRDTKGFRPNWHNQEQNRWYVEYDYELQELAVAFMGWQYASDHIYFASESDANASIESHPDVWKIYLGVEE